MEENMKMIATAITSCVLTVSAISAVSSSSVTAATCATPGNGYGRLFPNLASASFDSTALRSLAAQTMAAPETNPTPEGEIDAEENYGLPAGYTYFGQFIDHDLTSDDRPNDLTTPIAVDSLVNGRTPQLDLDSLYLAGPATAPQLYNTDQMHLLTGSLLTGSSDVNSRDVPRSATGRAILGDGRNDENRIVAGIHSMFIRFHNQTVDQVIAAHPQWTAAQVFTEARKQLTAVYQNLILQDYLPRVVGKKTMDAVLKPTRRGTSTRLKYYTNCAQMPVEFSVAAYRFGHSMVRGLYRVNAANVRVPVFSGSFGTPGIDLVGFSPSPSNFAIDWSLFLPGGKTTGGLVQASYKIDASITNSLSLLPLPVSSEGPADLAVRNLLRSSQVGLPSGQDVARSMGLRPLPDNQILIGKATGDATEALPITSISPTFAGKAPLWSYILAESTAHAYRIRNGAIVGAQRAPFTLGPVGGRIVAETIVGLLSSDANSVLNARTTTAPRVTSLKALFDVVEKEPGAAVRSIGRRESSFRENRSGFAQARAPRQPDLP
jgi:hypothetical protein